MSQPATHYLVTRFAIPEEHYTDWWNPYKPYFGLGSCAPDLFYFPTIPLLSLKYSRDMNWKSIADAMHSEKSYDIFCSMLDFAKCNKKNGRDGYDKQFVFSFGYYCHVVADCIFHPYVYRSTGDHWHSENFLHELEHKSQELRTDKGIIRDFYSDISAINYTCNNSDTELLDTSIIELFNHGLSMVYSNVYNTNFTQDDPDHPINQAYLAFKSFVPALFEGTKVYLLGKGEVCDTESIEADEQFFTSPYPNCGDLDAYEPKTLFLFASHVCKKIFVYSLNFWNDSSEISASDFFSDTNTTHYLNAGTNWNLDTGLSSSYNEDKEMIDESSAHYSYKIEQLKTIYEIINAEYIAEHNS